MGGASGGLAHLNWPESADGRRRGDHEDGERYCREGGERGERAQHLRLLTPLALRPLVPHELPAADHFSKRTSNIRESRGMSLEAK